MSNLDDKLKEIITNITTDHDTDTLQEVMDDYVAQIKQAFADETGFTNIMQDMTNMHANLKQDMLRLGLIPTPVKHTADFSN